MLLFYFLSVASPASVGLHSLNAKIHMTLYPFRNTVSPPQSCSHSARPRHDLLLTQ